MAKTIFDAVSPSTEKPSFKSSIFDAISSDIEGTSDKKKYIGQKEASDVAKQVALSGARGALSSYGNIAELARINPKESLTESQKQRYEQESKLPEHLLPYMTEEGLEGTGRLPTSGDILNLQRQLGLPAQGATPAGRIAGAAAEAFGSAAVIPGMGAAKAIPGAIGGALGQTAREVGAPEPLALGIDIAATLAGGKKAPGKFGKLTASKNQEEAIEFARKMGMTDKEITPLIQSATKKRWLGKLAKRDDKSEKIAKSSYDALSRAYDDISHRPQALRQFNTQEASQFANESIPIINDLPAGVRKLVERDAFDLVKDGITGDKLINFWKDLNYNISRGYTELGRLKGPVGKAIERLSPEISEDFQKTNQLYQKHIEMSKFLKPTQVDKFISGGKALADLGSVTGFLMTGDPKYLVPMVTHRVASGISRKLLTDPKMQNLGKQLGQALNENKYSVANRIAQEMSKGIEDEKLKKEIENIDFSIMNNPTKYK